jgi:microcompartment protein CcmK/EutM
MKLAKVVGTIVSTVKDPSLRGLKILMIQPLDDSQKSVGVPIAAMDIAQAGPGDLVWWTMGREASLALPTPFAPVDATITGIVDHVYQNDVGILDKKSIFTESRKK